MQLSAKDIQLNKVFKLFSRLSKAIPDTSWKAFYVNEISLLPVDQIVGKQFVDLYAVMKKNPMKFLELRLSKKTSKNMQNVKFLNNAEILIQKKA